MYKKYILLSTDIYLYGLDEEIIVFKYQSYNKDSFFNSYFFVLPPLVVCF